jgi:hypothetical protein
MITGHLPFSWQVEPRRPSDLNERDRQRYGEILASYGGSERGRLGVRRYRTAELCARSIGLALGVETTVALRRQSA